MFLYGIAQMRRHRKPFISSYQRTIRNPLINFNPVVETRPFVTRLICVHMDILFLIK